MKTIWRGTLALSGRMAQPFEAEIVEDDAGQPIILRRAGVSATVVSPHAISGEAWLRALVYAQKVVPCPRPTP